MKIFTIASQKGGVGKTSTVHALATGAAERGLRVLCIDLDAQGSLTHILRADASQPGSYELLHGQRVTPQATKGVNLITASLNLAGIDAELSDDKGKATRLRKALEPYRADFDICFIDTAPTLGMLLINALVAATDVIIPVKADTFALQSIYQLRGTINQVKQSLNPELNVAGVLFTQYSPRTILARDLWETTYNKADKMGYHCFLRQISNGVAIQEAQALGLSLHKYAPKAKPTQDYNKILDEILGGENDG